MLILIFGHRVSVVAGSSRLKSGGMVQSPGASFCHSHGEKGFLRHRIVCEPESLAGPNRVR